MYITKCEGEGGGSANSTTSVYIEAVPTHTTSLLQLQGLLLQRDPNRP